MGKRLLDKLTKEQLEQLPIIRDEWLGIGLATDPADRARAEAAVRKAYELSGLEPPPIVVWLGSPYAGAIGSWYLTQLLRGLAEASSRSGGDQVWDQVGDQVWDQVWDQVGDQVGTQVWDQVRAQVGTQVGDQVGDQVRDQVSWGRVGFGQHDAGWLGWVEAFQKFGVKKLERADGLIELARAAGWWWPMRGAVVLTERPRALGQDEEGRLHCEDGPAVLYPDSWAIWAWHGVRVPREVIEHPESLDPKQIAKEQNVEVRRVMVERYGPDRYLRDVGAQLIQQDEWGKLWRLDQPGDEPIVMVEVVNSTAEPDGHFKDYWLRVPPDMETARAAIAWTFDVPAEAYEPLVQT